MVQVRLGLGHGAHTQGSSGQWVGGGRGDAGRGCGGSWGGDPLQDACTHNVDDTFWVAAGTRVLWVNGELAQVSEGLVDNAQPFENILYSIRTSRLTFKFQPMFSLLLSKYKCARKYNFLNEVSKKNVNTNTSTWVSVPIQKEAKG